MSVTYASTAVTGSIFVELGFFTRIHVFSISESVIARLSVNSTQVTLAVVYFCTHSPVNERSDTVVAEAEVGLLFMVMNSSALERMVKSFCMLVARRFENTMYNLFLPTAATSSEKRGTTRSIEDILPVPVLVMRLPARSVMKLVASS